MAPTAKSLRFQSFHILSGVYASYPIATLYWDVLNTSPCRRLSVRCKIACIARNAFCAPSVSSGYMLAPMSNWLAVAYPCIFGILITPLSCTSRCLLTAPKIINGSRWFLPLALSASMLRSQLQSRDGCKQLLLKCGGPDRTRALLLSALCQLAPKSVRIWQ